MKELVKNGENLFTLIQQSGDIALASEVFFLVTEENQRLKTCEINETKAIPLTSKTFGILRTTGSAFLRLRRYNMEVFNVTEEGNVAIAHVQGEGEHERTKVCLLTGEEEKVLSGTIASYQESQETAKCQTTERARRFIGNIRSQLCGVSVDNYCETIEQEAKMEEDSDHNLFITEAMMQDLNITGNTNKEHFNFQFSFVEKESRKSAILEVFHNLLISSSWKIIVQQKTINRIQGTVEDSANDAATARFDMRRAPISKSRNMSKFTTYLYLHLKMPSHNAAYKILTEFDQKISELSSEERSVELLCRTCLSEGNRENRKSFGKFSLVKMSPTNSKCSKGHHIPPMNEQI